MEIHNGHACYDGYILIDQTESLLRRGFEITEKTNTTAAKRCPICAIENFLGRFPRRMTWDNWEHRDEIAGSMMHLAGWRPRGADTTCLLYGTSNPAQSYNGKTHVLCATGVEFIKKGRGVRYWNAGDFAAHHNESFAESVIEFHGIVLIDDLGNESDTFSTRDAVDRMFDARMRIQKATIIATGLSLLSIEKRYPRFHSRLKTATALPWEVESFVREPGQSDEPFFKEDGEFR